MMRLAGLLLLSTALSGFSQTSPKDPTPPPKVDAALRERITAFYQAQVEGKWRVADQYVAEDSKDAFFEQDKRRFPEFQIQKITYSDNFTRADVVVRCKVEWTPPPMDADMPPLKMSSYAPLTTHWKIDNAQWFWYKAATRDVNTIVGPVHLSEQQAAAVAQASQNPGLPTLSTPESVKSAAMDIMTKLRLDKGEIQLSSSSPNEATVTVVNDLDSAFTLRVDLDSFVPGLTTQFDHTRIEPHGKAVLKVRYDPKSSSPRSEVNARIVILPLERPLPFRITFTP